MTVKELRAALIAAEDDADVIVYVDISGEGERPFGLFDERLYICKYCDVQSAAYYEEDNTVILEFDGQTERKE